MAMESKQHFTVQSSHQPKTPWQDGPTKLPAWKETQGFRSAEVLLQSKGACVLGSVFYSFTQKEKTFFKFSVIDVHGQY